MDRIEQIESELALITPGTWRWGGTVDYLGHVRLESLVSGRPTVMAFGRAGMQGAEPIFYRHRSTGENRGWSGKAERARDVAVKEVQYRGDIVGMDSPNAVLIANAPDHLRWLVKRVKQLEEIIDGN